MNRPSSLLADGSLLLMTVFWGVSFVIVKDALDLADPLSFLSLRFGVGAVACLLVARGQLFDARLWRPGAWLGLFLFLGFLLQTWGLLYTTPSRSAFITSLFCAFVPLFQWLMFRRRPSPAVALGAGMAIVGAWFLTGASFGGGISLGDWLTLACAASYAVQIVLTGHWANQLPTGPLVAVEILVVAVVSTVFAAVGERRVTLSPELLGAAAAMGLIASALGILLQTWAQRRTSAHRAALIIALEPVFASAWSIYQGREPWVWSLATGGGLILLGVVISELKGPPPAPPIAL